jgi:hypothetical protein
VPTRLTSLIVKTITTATLDGVTRKKDKPEPTAEQTLAEDLVARAREHEGERRARARRASAPGDGMS